MATDYKYGRTYKLDADLKRYGFVKLNSAVAGEVEVVVAAPASTDLVFPAEFGCSGVAGQNITIQLFGIAKGIAAEAIAQGAQITSDADGKVVAGVDAVKKIALYAAAAGEDVEFFIY